MMEKDEDELKHGFIDQAISKDGTTIGYRQFGRGPGILVIHGSMSSGYNHIELARFLAGTFTVYLMDRRGRGLSGPYKQNHTIQTDIEDVIAILQKTGAMYVFGVSVGGLIALQAASQLSQIKKLAIYEPLIFDDQATPKAMVAELDRQLDNDDIAGALSTAMQKAQLGSPFMNNLPHWLMRFMSKGMMNWVPAGEYASFKDLAPCLHYEGKVIAEKSGQQASFSSIKADVLLLGGSKSSQFLKDAVIGVAHVLPSAQRKELIGLDHSSPWNKAVRGKPALIAQELLAFFA